MNLVSRNGARVVVRQVPGLLLFAAGVFSLPPLAFSLFHIVGGTDADGKIFCLFFGLLMLWLFLEFVATRERFNIDLAEQVLTRRVSGVFRHEQQVLDLRDIKSIGVELKLDQRGRTRRLRQYLYMYGRTEKFLLNSPAKLYLDHAKLGRLLSEVTRIPYQGQTGGD
jgi:hypothetical protein